MLVAVLTLCGCAAPAEEVVEVEQSAIIGGTDLTELQAQFYGLAAVYHPAPGGGWFPRPCSGRVVKSYQGFSYILTARHCVTADNEVDGTVVSPSSLRVFPRAAAGKPNPNPPSEALTPNSVAAMPITSVDSHARDVAVLSVNADWAGFVQQHGMWLGAPSAFSNTNLTPFGYGISVDDPDCHDNLSTVGAGTARAGQALLIAGATDPFPDGDLGGAYFINNFNSSGAIITCGDSGGPDFKVVGGRVHQIAVNSTGTGSPSTSTSTNIWVQNLIGGTYLSPNASPNLNVVWNSTTFVVSLHDGLIPPTGTALYYDPATKRINPVSAGRCLIPGNPVLIRDTCQNVTGQQWSLGTDGRITSVSDGTCLTASGPSVFTSACGSPLPSTQQWAFHPQLVAPATELYRFCAQENGTCSFSGTREVRYGANGSFFYKLVSNGTGCNNGVFGDPIQNVGKQCHMGLSGYTFCADEYGRCSFSGTRVVAYGVNGAYLFRTLTNGTDCNNGVFTDPVPGPLKHCFVK